MATETAEISFPNVQVLPVPQGMLIIMQHSALHNEQFLIPVEAADRIAIGHLGRRPAELLEEIRQIHAQQAQEAMECAAREQIARSGKLAIVRR